METNETEVHVSKESHIEELKNRISDLESDVQFHKNNSLAHQIKLSEQSQGTAENLTSVLESFIDNKLKDFYQEVEEIAKDAMWEVKDDIHSEVQSELEYEMENNVSEQIESEINGMNLVEKDELGHYVREIMEQTTLYTKMTISEAT